MASRYRARSARWFAALTAGLCTPLLVVAGPSQVGDDSKIEPNYLVKSQPEQLPIKSAQQATVERSGYKAGMIEERPEELLHRELRLPVSSMSYDRAVPANDLCVDAIDVGMLPAVLQGDTTEATDDQEAIDVGFCGTSPAAPGTWYSVVGTGNELSASLCTVTSHDSKINVYCGDCVDGLICVGGNDDFCGLQSEVSWCSEMGTTYLILVNGFDGAVGPYELTVSDSGVPCTDAVSCVPPPAVPNDFCDTAIDLGALPASIAGTTLGATVDDTVAPTCDGFTVEAPGVWYTVTGTGNTITADLCDGSTNYDSKLSAYCGDCEVELFCQAGNDDSCGTQSEISFCTVQGVTYYILVHGFSSNVGDFVLTVTDDGVPCDSALPCEPCMFMCDGDATPEGEPTCMDEYDDMFNGGCNSTIPVFSDIVCPAKICGTSGNFTFTDPVDGPLDSRDTDWYRFTLATPQLVTATVEAGFSALVGIVDTAGIDDCAGVSAFLTSAVSEECVPVSVQALLPAGTWYVFVSTSDFVGIADCGDEYQLEVACEDPPAVACCFPDGMCQDLLPADCTNAGGAPGALGTDCLSEICTVPCCFNDQSCSDLGPADCANAGGTPEGAVGTLCLAVTCPAPPPPNDLCDGAIGPLAVPSSTIGTTIGASTDSGTLECPEAIITSPGVWYTVLGTGNTMNASICGGSIDVNDEAKISVYCGDCEVELFCAGAVTNSNFDGCLSGPTEVSWCSSPNTLYYILVHGFGGNEFDFDLLLSDDGVACDNPANCEPCMYSCEDPNAIPEGEPTCMDEYDDMFNGGCSDPAELDPQFTDIVCPTTICGESGNFIFTDPIDGPLNFRDTDWYRLTLADPARVTMTITAGFDALIGFIDNGGAAVTCDLAGGFLNSAVIDGCVEGSISVDLDAGEHWLFVSTADFEGTPCGTPYQLTVTCEATGGCCLPEPPLFRAPCLQTTEDDCVNNLNGVYLGDGEACGGFAYASASCDSSFEDITATGTNTFLGDEADVLVPIGFNFSFYGVNYAEAYITDNGYISFSPISGDSFANQAIPDPIAPNNLVAPLWDDFDPGSGGGVYYETVGTAPNRRFIVQWDQVPQFFDADSNTFQLVLFESTGCIEFRYGLVTPEGFAGDYTIGVENQAGFLADSVPGAEAVDGNCVEFCPVAGEDPCPKCIGDVDGDGDTDIFDFATITAFFGQNVAPNTNGDLNGDGVVNIFDFMIEAADFGCGTSPAP